jgi:hypothetical protein
MQNEDPAIESKKRRIKMEMILKDSDLKKCLRNMVDLEVQLRDLKRKKIQIETEIAAADLHYKKCQTDQVVMQNELKRLKNSLNYL